jgi:PilZ domain
MLQNVATPSRRFNSRIPATQDVWVCWQCNGRDDISRVRDLSLGGLFLETSVLRAIGSPTKIDFLVGEGQIRTDAVVRHVLRGQGLGLKFTAVTEQDRPKFAALVRRLREQAST